MRSKKIVGLAVCFQLFCFLAEAQETFPVNGVADKRTGSYAFTNATIVKDAQTTIKNGTLLIKEGKIVFAGAQVTVPRDAVVTDCKGKFIYPSFIDAYTDYGIPAPAARAVQNFNAPSQITSNTKGAFGWNQAIKPEVSATDIFVADDNQAKPLRDLGFGTVLTHQKDGIARGTGAVVSLKKDNANIVMLKTRASANYSFSKGTSAQSYPQSMMGSIALLRQTFLDARWYKQKPADEGINLSLQAWNDNLDLPQIFEANDKWNDLRADRIGDEFQKQFILKGGGNEFERINEMLSTKAGFILPLNFPQAMDVEDPNEARFVSLETLKYWEMAPSNPAAFEKAGISFCLTTADLKDPKVFIANLRKAIEFGLSETKALEALTKTPATFLNIFNETGSLEAGKWANFLITDGPVFAEKTNLLQNWIQGEKYIIKDDVSKTNAGTYNLVITSATGTVSYTLDVKSNNAATLFGKDSLNVKYRSDGKLVNINFSPVASKKKPSNTNEAKPADTSKVRQGQERVRQARDSALVASTPDDQMPDNRPLTQPAILNTGRNGMNAPGDPTYRLNGVNNGYLMQGNGVDTAGNPVTWNATFIKAPAEKTDSARKKPAPVIGNLTYPNMAYGWKDLPVQEKVLIKNATVWTSDKEGILQNTDVLIENGKIISVGKNLSGNGARIIDGTGKHLTPGIIDEHSHIATTSINEGGQSVSSEVRIGDNLDPDDINIYRQLSGGVTTSHILHGSANAIGGQTQLIKLRWGRNDDDLKFKGADGFIKFALGENVKRTYIPQTNNRFPDSRMGVEQLQMDAFTRAKDYEHALKGPDGKSVRRDLELDALVEIMNQKRFITCHSYIQSEIIETMRMAEQFGFKINTFTHILEGYKVADKMKAHGANASTFSDWWAYKVEVQDAIPYNAAIMHNVGLNVAINSDDAEMARRLNQEAAKSIKYAKMSEEEALKMVTINPAVMLHIDKTAGSIKPGKDADLVLWSDNPLSIYAKAEKTFVDGILYFDREKDRQLRKEILTERNRIIQKMLSDKKSGGPSVPATPTLTKINVCEDHQHNHGLLTLEDSE